MQIEGITGLLFHLPQNKDNYKPSLSESVVQVHVLRQGMGPITAVVAFNVSCNRVLVLHSKQYPIVPPNVPIVSLYIIQLQYHLTCTVLETVNQFIIFSWFTFNNFLGNKYDSVLYQFVVITQFLHPGYHLFKIKIFLLGIFLRLSLILITFDNEGM